MVGLDHYENFPVASVLCPPRLRPPILAIYRFARVADDLADEGTAAPAERLADLAAFRADLEAVIAGRAPGPRWPALFAELATQLAAFSLPAQCLRDLLDAFEQDVHNPVYPDRQSLLDYCRRSADPVGRLLLHLYAITDPRALRQADAVCSALQLINFWQDLSVDAPRGRHYVPESELARYSFTFDEWRQASDSPRSRALVATLCDWARELMLKGAPLALRVPGRAGWELRLVVQGGLLVLERIARMDHATLARRPKLGPADVPLLLWRALSMRAARR